MSTINQALSELTVKAQSAEIKIEKAQINKVKPRPVLPWIIGGFSISLALGGWAVSQQSDTIEQIVLTSEPVALEVDNQRSEEAELSLATKVASASVSKGSSEQVTIYQASSEVVEKNPDPVDQAKQRSQSEQITQSKQVKKVDQPLAVATATQSTIKELPKAAQVKPVENEILDKPLLLASNSQPVVKTKTLSPTPVQASVASKPNTVIIEQVELTPAQLAEKAEQRARKAIDSNNIDEALSSYKEALRYTPRNENIRQQLAALYYGKGDARQAFEILQDGIKIDNDSEVIRIALSKLLIKEQQHEAALTPLIHLNHNPSVDYLSLRAALAQRNNLDDIALETYQQLVVVEDSNARWWLGLAIQQERNADMPKAKESYEQALTKVGLSRQSQTFVRERIKLLTSLESSSSKEESSSAN
ncbi:tetratricopeptide repeat protein [Vibrio lamellibrachiae]|uniref:tetratricopeptide repeat protein n=1 Tax=Vibrio lamellibrachiae TaxID=2910253 RepID=UPI003D09A153